MRYSKIKEARQAKNKRRKTAILNEDEDFAKDHMREIFFVDFSLLKKYIKLIYVRYI